MSIHLTYRPEIDGLRALAVLPVVLFHAQLKCPGGYVGVDVFFVISGFLITSLILRDLKATSSSGGNLASHNDNPPLDRERIRKY